MTPHEVRIVIFATIIMLLLLMARVYRLLIHGRLQGVNARPPPSLKNQKIFMWGHFFLLIGSFFSLCESFSSYGCFLYIIFCGRPYDLLLVYYIKSTGHLTTVSCFHTFVQILVFTFCSVLVFFVNLFANVLFH